ncbi:hypothetical protein AC1031_020715 [Aphanomyces cochlioides]|nr:hypothetical protein AC1031_020715 [Aphanomyces cochlioides]
MIVIFVVVVVNLILAAVDGAIHPRAEGILEHHRVFGGSKASIDAFPWIAGIRFQPNTSAFCGGSLIAPQYVITAAHCVNFRFVAPSILYVSIGSNYANGTDPEGEIRSVTTYWLAPSFQSAQRGSDFAILKLDQPSTKPTIPLGDCWVGANTSTTLLGWGQTTNDADSASFNLLQANLTVIDSAVCQARVRASNDTMYATWSVNETQMCAGGVNGTGSCYGDSGGPLLARKTNGGTLALVGGVSFGVNCAKGVPDVFGRITAAKDFIDSHVQGHKWI